VRTARAKPSDNHFPELPLDLPPAVTQKLDDAGMGDLLKELAASRNDRTALLKLVEELLARIAELEAAIRDLKQANEALESRVKELEWCEEEYQKAKENSTMLISLQKENRARRTTLESENNALRQTSDALKRKLAVVSVAQEADTTSGGDNKGGSYSELLSQLDRLQRDYDAAMGRLRKLLEWTRMQARRTWQEDGQAQNCNACDRQFTFLLRRHHCRICGKVFCRYCAFCRVQTTLQKRPVRACAPCYQYVQKTVNDDDSEGCVELRVVVERGPTMMPLEFLYSSSTNEQYGGTEVRIDAVESGTRHSVTSEEGSSAIEQLMAGDRILCVNGVNVSSVPIPEIDALFESALLKIDIERPPDPTQKLEADTSRMEELMRIDELQRSGISTSPRYGEFYDDDSDVDDEDLQLPGDEREGATSQNDLLMTPESWRPLSESPGAAPASKNVLNEEDEEAGYIALAPDDDYPSESKRNIEPADVGRRVSVDGYACRGYLRFVGAHKVTGEIRCGVELDKPLGKNNGTVSRHFYFECAKMHGVLCNPAKVTLLAHLEPHPLHI